MIGPRDCHTEWNKSDRERQKSYDITYMWNLKKWGYEWTYPKQKQRYRCRKQTYGHQGVRRGRDNLGGWDWHIHTTMQMAPTLWPPDVKSQLAGQDPDAGKDWRQGEEGTTEDEMAGWHPWLDGHEFEQAPEMGKGRQTCCAAVHGVAEPDMT